MCDCDCERPDIQDGPRTVVGRKQHHCCECGRPIARGESHRYFKGLFEGHWHTYRWCTQCSELRADLEDSGWCVCLGEIYDVLNERPWGPLTEDDPIVRAFYDRFCAAHGELYRPEAV